MKRSPVPQPVPQELTELVLAAYLKGGGKLCLTVEEAGALLGWSKTKAYQAVNEGELPSCQIGGMRKVTIALLLEYIANQEAGARRRR